ncbi:16S rRNA (cytidine(1402)-2'-O)-methyltransferase [Leptospira langatensis]|uniref:Ribosomal RNA small subunit methyltransferase I n=1 Tax=Leptospira langatensis TaxID=2484983 RepID=A0A5F1ZQV4_9LEPT|nr:16S rRNA (cytidine(1402)-2'-O)-methyltransferase [Leptospira langatensis]TGK05320.1 16S rRNA (cytidine(1402)-2'-O)-methyltransferase [Leptospira langatensis]TGL38456.1 16S rRNA (cytidine(1402)-2'-O)-methyltransferase [Leptospira langatensis]
MTTPEGDPRFQIQPGTAYVVATPIGNLEDITLRALQVLKQSDVIYCENAQHSRRLLQTYGINTLAKTLYKDQSDRPFSGIIQDLRAGKTLALVSDAGTPGVSDPGSQLVRVLREEKLPIVPVPGPSALTAMLSISGWQVQPSVFLGFLSEKKQKKRNQLREWESFEGAMALFESVHRIKDTLAALREVFPSSPMLLGRELTKIHEEILKIDPSQDLETLKFPEKGEFVVLIYTNPKKMLNGRVGDTDT